MLVAAPLPARHRRHPGRPGPWPAALLVLALAAACSAGEEPAPTTTPATSSSSPAPVVADKQAPPDPEVTPTWPLTGEAAGDDLADRPALSIKVENSPAARPQSGLQGADVVWEEMVEGGITRFNAVYHSELPAQVGPVRSVRPMDAAIAAPYGGVLAASGGQGPFISSIREAGLQVVTHDLGHSGFTRSPARSAPHNLYGTPSLFLDQADSAHSEPPPEQLEFSRRAEGATAVTDGTPAEEVRISFPRANPGWTWDADEGLWRRTEDGEPASTADAGQITAVNLVILRVQVSTTSYVDPSGANVPETILSGSGEAIVASGGHSLEVSWSKDGAGSPLVLTTTAGESVDLAPGNTWIELVPASGSSVDLS